MKKLLVLALVLSIASLAQAGLTIQLYQGGTAYNAVTDAPLTVGDTLEVRLVAVGGDTGDSNPTLFVDETYGILTKTSGTINMPPAPTATLWQGEAKNDNYVTGMTDTEDGLFGAIGDFSASPPYADGTYISGIVFTCVAAGDAVLKLVNVAANYDVLPENGGIAMDSVVIHQIPEPITMCLLGLGGLFLRRRSK